MEANGRLARSLDDEKEWASSYLGFILWIDIFLDIYGIKGKVINSHQDFFARSQGDFLQGQIDSIVLTWEY